ncbi:FISUMP domain-containing protein [Fibrobacter sp.]|uniref:FISUMP domain-containing protein n=1 Tax=Fibrobacter sp. TaxID=35828 RepID=UPI00388FA295
MKSSYKMATATCALSFALAFTACDDSTSASDNGGNGGNGGTNTPCTDAIQAECPATLEEGTICDTRDGKIYKVATFDTQTWMTENLNYNSCEINGQNWCYGGDAANCQKYGRLYTWTAAMGLDKSYQKNYANLPEGTVTNGLCPVGYHIPSDAETDILIAYLEDNDKVANFNFQFGGKNNFAGFADLDRTAYFWTADEDHSEFGGKENVRIWSYSETFSFGGGSVFKDSGLSVRCVKD